MNKKIKNKWVEALRSRTYPQGISFLHEGDNFCVLGVLCDLYLQEHNQVWESDPDYPCDLYFIEGCNLTTPPNVQAWAELEENNPVIYFLGTPNDESEISLSDLNDVHNVSFSQLADLIEQEHTL